jgi:hypothetical protein
MIGYTYSDSTGCMDDMKLTSRYSFSMGLEVVSWSMKNKPILSLSMEEAKYKETMIEAFETVFSRTNTSSLPCHTTSKYPVQ